MDKVEDIFAWFKRRKATEYLSLIAATIGILDIFWIDVTWITVTLLAIAIAPWLFSLEQLHRYVKSFEAPGGLKFELREVSEEAETITLEKNSKSKDVDAFLDTIKDNPNLTLVGIRIEIEKRLRLLARLANIAEADKLIPTLRLASLLWKQELLTQEEFGLYRDLSSILNRAAHAEHIDAETQLWAIKAAMPLINNLDVRAEKIMDDAERAGQENC